MDSDDNDNGRPSTPMDEFDQEDQGATGGQQEEYIMVIPTTAMARLSRAVDHVRQATTPLKRKRSQRKLKKLRARGLSQQWWSEEQYEIESKLLMEASEPSSNSSESSEESDLSGPEDKRRKTNPVKGAKKATFKKLPLDVLMDRQDQTWLRPRRATNYMEMLVHRPLPIFHGDRDLDNTTAAEWAREVSAILFLDAGAPVEEGVYLIRRCFPESSRTMYWHSEFLAMHPEPTFGAFMKKFVPFFTDPGVKSDYENDLFHLRQNDLTFWQFAGKHSSLWRKVNPGADLEADMVRDWGHRLNSRCTQLFRAYLQKLRETNKKATYNHAIEYMDRKLKMDKVDKGAIFAVAKDAATEAWVPCDLGCKFKRHRPGQNCPARNAKCHDCSEVGHFAGSPWCKKKGAGGVGRVMQMRRERREEYDRWKKDNPPRARSATPPLVASPKPAKMVK